MDKHLISTVFFGFCADFACFRRFLRIGSVQSRDLSGFGAFGAGPREPLECPLSQAEKHSPFRREGRGDGRVERVHHGRGDLEVANHDVGNVFLESGLGR
jgi:hypothetical protein